MRSLFVFRELQAQPWWRTLAVLERSLEGGVAQEVVDAYGDLVSELISCGHASLTEAATTVLCDGEEILACRRAQLPSGLRLAARLDLEFVRDLVSVDWQARAQGSSERPLPPLDGLATPSSSIDWQGRLLQDEPDELLDALVDRYRACGVGILSRHLAFRWRDGRLEGVGHPAADRMQELVGLERQLQRLTDNVERFLSGAPALHTLLYGPRGSGKSTAVRSLLGRYAQAGLRLVEVGPESLLGLPELAERLRNSPHRYLAFVDDLTFESGDWGYQPLKTLLEGSVAEAPGNILLVATSNRRHLVRESLADRPLPEDDDVHAWDTSQERLALADRFGLVITFPSASQREYLLMVRELARSRRVTLAGEELDREAIRFADWGNGYSGRTANQFVDTLT